MMKFTLAFLATLATTEAAHGRRHVRRDDYGYKPYPVPSKSSSSAPFPLSTGVPSSAPAPASSSSSLISAPGTGVPSFSLDLTSTGAPGIPSSAPGVSFPGSPSGSVSLSVGSIAPSSVADASTVIVKSSTRPPFPSGTGSNPPVGTGGVKPPVGTGASIPYGEYVTTTTIYSTQIKTIIVTKGGEVATSLSTHVVAIPSKCTKTSGVADSTPTIKSEPITKVVHVSTETLTYTVGVGSTAHAVTTEIVQTSTETIYKTIVVTLPYPGNGNHGGATTTGGADKPEGTTVISQTSTTTKFITVYPTPSAGAEGSVVPPAPTGGDAPVCVPPKTVTVTEKETVTVTAGKEEIPATHVPVSTPILSEAKPTTLPTTAPFPFGNSTTVVIPGSTGFATFTKTSSGLVGTGTAPAGSTATIGTDIPTPTNTVIASSTKGTEASTGLPSFAFPSKEAVSTTGAPAKGTSSTAVPAKPTTSAAPIGYTPPKGNYGYRRRA